MQRYTFVYSADPVLGTGQSVHFIATNSASMGRFQHAAMTDPHPLYSFVQLSELKQRGVNEIDKVSKRQHKDTEPGALD